MCSQPWSPCPPSLAPSSLGFQATLSNPGFQLVRLVVALRHDGPTIGACRLGRSPLVLSEAPYHAAERDSPLRTRHHAPPRLPRSRPAGPGAEGDTAGARV